MAGSPAFYYASERSFAVYTILLIGQPGLLKTQGFESAEKRPRFRRQNQ